MTDITDHIEQEETSLSPTLRASRELGQDEMRLIAETIRNIGEVNQAVHALANVGIVTDVGLVPLTPLPGTTTPIPHLDVRFFMTIWDSVQEKS